jgi:hypothetical protein
MLVFRDLQFIDANNLRQLRNWFEKGAVRQREGNMRLFSFIYLIHDRLLVRQPTMAQD